MLNAISTAPCSGKNYLIAALPADVQKRLLHHLELVYLPPGKVLYESGDTLHYVYFPTDCIIALLCDLENGVSAESSMIGYEGVLGNALFLGGEYTTGRAIVQSPGYAYRMSAKIFKAELSHHSEVLTFLLRHTQTLLTQMGQAAVCNRHHSIDQQLCRWILMSLDRLPGNTLLITHELIANMLGVRRESVTEAAGKLQKFGVISCQRGHVEVLDRPRLERMSCECYAVVKKEADRLFPKQSIARTTRSIACIFQSEPATCPWRTPTSSCYC